MKKVSALIPFYDLATEKYLQLAVKGLLEQVGIDMEIVIGSSALGKPNLPDDPRIKIIDCPRDMRSSLACNEAQKQSRPDSDYYFLTSDDVIIPRQTIGIMTAILGDLPMILNPISNCDIGFWFHAMMHVESQGKLLAMVPNMKIEQIAGFEEAILNIGMTAMFPMIQPVLFNNLYASLVPKKIYDMLKGYATDLAFGNEDTELNLRAQKAGIATCYTPNAFAFHFGGTTSSTRLTQDDRKMADELFYKKWQVDLSKMRSTNITTLYGIRDLLK
jgi:hypothetical protein